MILINKENIDVQLRGLLTANHDEPDFVEHLAELMASAADSTLQWILMVDEGQTHVLSESDHFVEQYQLLASRHEAFHAVRDAAIEEKRVVVLPLDPTSDAEDQMFGRITSRLQRPEDPLLNFGSYAFFVPIQCSVDADLVVCLYCEHRRGADITNLTRQLTLLSLLGQARMDTLRTQELSINVANQQSQISESQRTLNRALQVSNVVAHGLEKGKLSYVMANQLRQYFDVDRVTILDQVGRKSKMLATSGQATFNRRSNIVRCTQKMAKIILKSGDALWFDGNQDELAGPVQKAVGKYVDESLVQNFALIPIYEAVGSEFPSDEQSLIELVNPGRTKAKKLRGAILLESIERPMDFDVTRQRWERVQSQVTGQFNNAKRYSDLFLLPLILMFTRLAALFRGHTARKAWATTMLVTAAIVAGFVIKDDFLVRCEGYLQPEQMHHVFVREDGIVKEVLVKEGQMVKQGDALVSLRNRELEFEIASLTGELKENRKKQEQLMYQRLTYVGDRTGGQYERNYEQLAQQTGLLESRIEAAQKTLAIKQRQLQDLVVRAPFDGQVMGWNVDRRFLSRPLEQGTRLFSVAKANQQHMLELKVPDQRSGYIATAWRENTSDNQDLKVEFSIASIPGERFTGMVTHVNPGLEQDSDLGYVLPVEARPEGTLPANLRAGIPIIAKVNCGRQAWIYCKTYEFIDWIQQKSFDYFI